MKSEGADADARAQNRDIRGEVQQQKYASQPPMQKKSNTDIDGVVRWKYGSKLGREDIARLQMSQESKTFDCNLAPAEGHQRDREDFNSSNMLFLIRFITLI